jgi:HTH-type transcriptional regulator/antitoxin HipB
MINEAKTPKISSFEVVVRDVDQLGAALMRFRRQEKWTQEQVGKKFCVKQAIISSVESGAPGTRLSTLFKVLAALDLEIVIRKRRKTTITFTSRKT